MKEVEMQRVRALMAFQAGLRVRLLQKAAPKESRGRGRNGVEIRLCQAGLRVTLLQKAALKEMDITIR